MTNAPIFDPKGLIKAAFAIDGIAASECRSIFLDWALGVPVDQSAQTEVRALLDHYAPHQSADHPMIATLEAALHDAVPPRRRGGRASRVGT